ncbi:MAG: isoprenylcysteine carboxylmethyltransferase family protein, partial [Sulfurimonadaceae bacterium]|nr:isoprenylcysteine carboxylmethyltransferase family protein [Sulfurimonadaceae bacterium]
KTLITTGVYALSRNPIYLSLVTAHVALGFIAGSLWLIVSAFVLLLLLDRIVIAGEEEVLELRFPRSYSSYRSKTRRWL